MINRNQSSGSFDGIMAATTHADNVTIISNYDGIPQWKKDLIARLRNQIRKSETVLVGHQPTTATNHNSSYPHHPPTNHHQEEHHPSDYSTITTSSTRPTSAPIVSHKQQHQACTVLPTRIRLTSSSNINSASTGRTMVQERTWHDFVADMVNITNAKSVESIMSDEDGSIMNKRDPKSCSPYDWKHTDEDEAEEDRSSEEDLHYGPGIVNKLKNKYLSLALRESNSRNRPTIMRKAASLENMLDGNDEDEDGDNLDIKRTHRRLFQSRHNGHDPVSSSRYRPIGRRLEMKRARSVETISRNDDVIDVPITNNRQSLHEDMLIKLAAEDDVVGKNEITTAKCLNTNNINSVLECESNATVNSNKVNNKMNKPKRLQPIVSEKEKPPADFVKQAKMIFEKRPEQRTKKPPQTGDVAAKVDSFNSIIVQAKAAKKPPIKHAKPVHLDKNKCNTQNIRPSAKPVIMNNDEIISNKKQPPQTLNLKQSVDRKSMLSPLSPNNRDSPPILSPKERFSPIYKPVLLSPVTRKDLDISNKSNAKNKDETLSSPIPDVSRTDYDGDSSNSLTSLSQTPDLIMISNHLPLMSSPQLNKMKTTEDFIREEIIANRTHSTPQQKHKRNQELTSPDSPGYKTISPILQSNISRNSQTTFNFTITSNTKAEQKYSPTNSNVSDVKVPPSEPLRVEIEEQRPAPKVATNLVVIDSQINVSSTKCDAASNNRVCSPPPPVAVVVNRVVSVNVKNSSDESKVVFPKKKSKRQDSSSTSRVFDFTKRKDVPDYIPNDKSRSPSRPELPKPGEGGIIILPGLSSSLESFLNEEEEERSLLIAPPSPCNVTFINDNILIDGKSSLNQSIRKIKMKISFVEEAEIYEYPSETSAIDEIPLPTNSAQVGHSVPTLSGSSLANYTPKSTTEFQLGVTRVIQQQQSESAKPDVTDVEPSTSDVILEEVESPMLFSAGRNADILF